ncbi:SDR family oxidoreductase [Lentzea tibetensis]|uniref:SDR family oxidoreductase n=1 Tax=Lentzea tibetensis TaxID=2591470 RepID=A0A563EN42_9PSEU|nr:SDR family oxidoreductase [Lentzea tibetensis]
MVVDVRVVITGAGRGFGRVLAIALASLGAEVVVAARNLVAAERTRDEIIALGHHRVHAVQCDLSDPASIRRCAEQVSDELGYVDVLVNNAAGWLEGHDVWDADDTEIMRTITSGVGGTVLMTKHFLPLLKRSSRPDVVTLVSSAATPRSDGVPEAHPAFYAAKHGQAGFVEVMSQRLRKAGIRMISLYPPEFEDADPAAPRTSDGKLTAQSVVDCVVFAVGQPRDCFIRAFHFESA